MSDSEDAKKANLWPLNPCFPFNPDNPIYPSWPSGLNMPLINHFNMPLSGAVQQSIADRVNDLEQLTKKLEANSANIESNLKKIACNEKAVINILIHLHSASDFVGDFVKTLAPVIADHKEGLQKLIGELKAEKKRLEDLERKGSMDIFSEIRKEQIEKILNKYSPDKETLSSTLELIAGFQDKIKQLIKELGEQQVLPEESLLDKLQDLKRLDKAAFQKVMKTIESEIKKAKG